MWDEQERFARAACVFLGVLFAGVGMVFVALSIASGTVQFLKAYLTFVGILAGFVAVWGACMGGVMLIGVGLGRGMGFVWRWIRTVWMWIQMDR